MPRFCDGCSQPFEISHALDCKNGGLVSDYERTILRESNSDGESALRVDWGVRSFCNFQREALFDMRVLNADASYLSNSLASIVDSAHVENKTSTVQLQRMDGYLSHLSSALVKLYSTMKQ